MSSSCDFLCSLSVLLPPPGGLQRGKGERDPPHGFPLSSLSPVQEESFICSLNAGWPLKILSRSVWLVRGARLKFSGFLGRWERWGGGLVGAWGSDFLSLCGFQKKNHANVCILCIRETNGITVDYRVFLRTVHQEGAPGTGRQVRLVLQSSGFALGRPPGGRPSWVIVSWIDSGSSSKPASFPSVSSYTHT